VVATPAAARFSPAVSASQPIATIARVASTQSTTSFFSKTIRTPAGAFSNPRMRPKSSRTSMPEARNDAAMVRETSSGSSGSGVHVRV
jgi:hypothetical protein